MVEELTEVQKPIVVSPNAGLMDTLAALLRYSVVLIAGISAILGFLENQDIVGILNWIRGAEGVKFIAAIAAVGTMAYGLFRTGRRGTEIATVAADPRVPKRVAHLKN